jgi:hypothetical protein
VPRRTVAKAMMIEHIDEAISCFLARRISVQNIRFYPPSA